MCVQSSGRPWLYLEVGFNAGHSSAILLASFSSARLRSFDLCEHSYTLPNYELLLNHFGEHRLLLTCGDSRSSLTSADPGVNLEGIPESALADLVHIDGGHSFGVSIMNDISDVSLTCVLASTFSNSCRCTVLRLCSGCLGRYCKRSPPCSPWRPRHCRRLHQS